MKYNLILSAVFFSISLFSSGQDSAILKRTPYNLRVIVDKDQYYEDSIGATPYVLPDKTIQIYPGETIYVELVEENGIIKILYKKTMVAGQLAYVYSTSPDSAFFDVKFSEDKSIKVLIIIIIFLIEKNYTAFAYCI